jgi:hypothetical protein
MDIVNEIKKIVMSSWDQTRKENEIAKILKKGNKMDQTTRERIEKLQVLMNVESNGGGLEDPYNVGYANGLIRAFSIMTDSKPNFLERQTELHYTEVKITKKEEDLLNKGIITQNEFVKMSGETVNDVRRRLGLEELKTPEMGEVIQGVDFGKQDYSAIVEVKKDKINAEAIAHSVYDPYFPPEEYSSKDIKHNAYEHEPKPIHNDGPHVWDLVVYDMAKRKAMGFEKHKTHLQPFNGRSALWDAYQEALDLVVYLRQYIYEMENPQAIFEQGPHNSNIDADLLTPDMLGEDQ